MCELRSDGYHLAMPERPRELVHEIVEEVKSLEHEADEGKTARTPLLVLGGITMVVSTVIVILLIVAFAAYYLTR